MRTAVMPTRQLPPAPRPASIVVTRRATMSRPRAMRRLTPLSWAALLGVPAGVTLYVASWTTIELPPVVRSAVVIPAPLIEVPALALAAPKIDPGVTLPAASRQPPTPPPLTTTPFAPAGLPVVSSALLSEPPPATAVTAVTLPAAPAPSPLAAVPEVPAPVPVPASGTPDRAAIEAVLGRYSSAYSALDAGGVQKAFPQVDRRALERTFAGLAEQSLAFDDCRIDITGRDARATCSGSARSTTKNGSRPQLESRRWDFTLSKIGSAWLILSAQSRR